ncbi:MAG: CHAT domain-containing protein [Bacteroidetes bacterium]|nr:MAG: CHAT domain-containing protein [Bacteroidota bacterium]
MRAFRFAERDRSQLLRAAYRHELATSTELSLEQQQAESKWQYEVQQAEARLHHLQAQGAPDSVLTAAEQAVWRARNGRYQFLQALEQENPRYYQLKYADDIPRLDELQDMLAAGQLLVEYFVGKKRLYVFTLARDSELKLLELPLPDRLEERVMAWRRSIEAYQKRQVDRAALLATYRQEGYKLYQELLAPVLAEQSATSLLLIPSGVLDLLPFEALLQKVTNAQADLRQYPYLLKQYPISYGYSASLQYILHQLPYAGRGFGGYIPTFDGRAGWQALSCSQQTLQDLPWPTSKVLYENHQANRQNFFDHAGQFSVLHLATHAQANAEQGDFSFIVFSDGEAAYDSLFAQSLYHLNLPNELVVLSACETALGTLYQSEGVISLARAFHYAGARSVLNTLWPVNEGANCRLMPSFYEALNRGTDKATALQSAKLTYLNKADERAAHPVYWAGYQLLGTPRPLAPRHRVWGWLALAAAIALVLGIWWYRHAKATQPPKLQLT